MILLLMLAAEKVLLLLVISFDILVTSVRLVTKVCAPWDICLVGDTVSHNANVQYILNGPSFVVFEFLWLYSKLFMD